MHDTISQIFILFACMFSGVISGTVYEPFYLLRKFINNRVAKIIFDVLFFALFSIIFVAISVIFNFPKIRFFMFIGAFCGLFLYLITLHRIVAFLFEKLYNIIKQVVRCLKNRLGKTNERRKS